MRKAVDFICDEADGLPDSMILCPFYALRKHFVNHRSYLALFGRQPGVAAAHGKAIGLATNRTVHDFEFEPFQLYHTAYHSNLLEVLLAEISAVGFHGGKQFADYLGVQCTG